MSADLVLWVVLAPAIGAIVSPLFAALATRQRVAEGFYPLAHLAILVLTIQALRSPPEGATIGLHGTPASSQLYLALDRANGVQLAVAGALFLVLGAFAPAFVRGTRHGHAFLTYLLWLQAAVNLTLVAADLLGLYLGLLLISFSLVLMIGLDFGAAGQNAALRVFATLEVPAAVALTSLWMIDARVETASLSTLAQSAPWLARPDAWPLTVPIVVALLSRTGLVPFSKWVGIACRASAGPVAVAIAGIALPVGVIAFARIVAAVPFAGDWRSGLEAIAAATALVAAVAAMREKGSRGWLAYVAVAQVAFAALGFTEQNVDGQAAAWLTLIGGATIITLVGLGLATALRATQRDELPTLVDRSLGRLPATMMSIGYLALAPIPPFSTFAGRRALVASLLTGGSRVDLASAFAVLLATTILAAATWRHAVGNLSVDTPAVRAGATPAKRSTAPQVRAKEPVTNGRQEASPPSPTRGEADPSLGPVSALALMALTGCVITMSIVPEAQWASAVGAVWPRTDPLRDGVSSLLVGLAVGGSLGWGVISSRLAVRAPHSPDAWRQLKRLENRYGLGRVTDPYLMVGGILLTLGRFSSSLLNNTLGRLVRAN
jgi:formate hydrogenlyase subunit 3/multisubunit Na+/H+ antiporter MnhD subunit